MLPFKRHASEAGPLRPYLAAEAPASLRSECGAHHWFNDFRISDNSHSDANPAQRKKGGCKSVSLMVTFSDRTFVVPGKCDVRKSFSNRSFAQYYDRAAVAVVPLDAASGLFLTVEELHKGRDGKFFVAMEKSRCRIDQRPTNPRHPLLAFAAESIYRINVVAENGAELKSAVCKLDARCHFQQGTATVAPKGNVEASSASMPSVSPVKLQEKGGSKPVQTVSIKEDPPVEDMQQQHYHPPRYPPLPLASSALSSVLGKRLYEPVAEDASARSASEGKKQARCSYVPLAGLASPDSFASFPTDVTDVTDVEDFFVSSGSVFSDSPASPRSPFSIDSTSSDSDSVDLTDFLSLELPAFNAAAVGCIGNGLAPSAPHLFSSPLFSACAAASVSAASPFVGPAWDSASWLHYAEFTEFSLHA